ncbi:MAG: UDP-3-O-(3-hydroxymyristoyl)glucosamine N-acyltransferase [Nonlabens sp.]
MKFTIGQIAEVLEGEVVGNPEDEVHTLSKIEEGKEGSLSFLSNEKYLSYVYTTEATAVIIDSNFVLDKGTSCTLIKVDDSYASFTRILKMYQEAKSFKEGIEQPSYIHESSSYGASFYLGAFSYISKKVKMGDHVKVHPQAFIGDNVIIGNNVTIQSGVKIMSDCVIGDRVTIESGSIIGADGFGYAPQKDGSYDKIPQIGNVIIGNDVNIGALTTIDRATMGSTIIDDGTKLDNQIQVGHNVEIGKHTVIAAQTGVAGSSKIGDYCRIGGQVGIAGHLKIENNVGIQAQSGIARNIKEGMVIQGSPAYELGDFNRSYVHFKNLPKIEKRITDLEKKQS